MTYSAEMEMATLGSMLLGDSQVNEGIKSILQGSDVFYNHGHRQIYDVCSRLSVNGRSVADLETVAYELGEEGLIEIGGLEYLIDVAAYVPSPANGEEYARKVLECWTRRQFEQLGRRAVDLSPDELHIEAEGIKNRTVRGAASFDAVIAGSLGDDQTKGQPTGWAMLDEILSCGGFPCGQVWMPRAKQGVGKTPFLTQAALYGASKGRRVCYVTVADLDKKGLQSRMMKHLTGWASAPTLNLDMAQDWKEAKDRLKSWNVTIFDATREIVPVETIILWIERQEPFDEVYIDYLQELRMARQLDRMENQAEAVSALKRMASRLDIPVGIGSQVTNSPTEGLMAKGGRDADEKAALILDIIPDNDAGEVGTLKVSKNRYGMKTELAFDFDRKKLAFNLREKTS
jgi:replicative DNA helicase